MRLVSRADWGARPPRSRTPLDRAAQLGTAVHYSAADADEQSDHARCAIRVRAIQAFHMDARGWADIAYSYLACKHGLVYEGRGRGVRTAAQGTTAGNDAWHAVCFLGDDTPARDDVTDAGREAVRDTVLHCNAWSDATGVRPHSAFHATACPGDQLRDWVAAGMPLATPKEDDMPLSAEDLKAIDQLVKARVDAAVGLLIRGDDPDPATGDTHPNSLQRVRADIASQSGALSALEMAVAAVLQQARANGSGLTSLGSQVAQLGTAGLSQEQIDLLARLLHERGVIAGSPTYTTAGPVRFVPEAPA